MKLQQPAEGILVHHDWGDTKMYKVMCCCGSVECDHTVQVEADDVGVSVTSYVKHTSPFWNTSRWQMIWKLLTRGYAEYEAVIIMTEQQTYNYANTLLTAVSDVAEFRKKHLAKRK
jgi:hypothetical protein